MTAEDDDYEGPTIITPPNRIKDKVTLGGRIKSGGMDPELLKRAEARAESMSDVFLEAADQDCDRLSQACKLAQSEPQKRGAHLQTVQAVAHDMKSYGKNIGYDLLTAFADSLSTFLRKSQTSNDIKLEISKVHVDAIRLVLGQQIKGEGGKIGQALWQGLTSAINKHRDYTD